MSRFFHVCKVQGMGAGMLGSRKVGSQRSSEATTALIIPFQVEAYGPLFNDALRLFSGCSVPDVTDNVCGDEACTPGTVGYTCGERLKRKKQCCGRYRGGSFSLMEEPPAPVEQWYIPGTAFTTPTA